MSFKLPMNSLCLFIGRVKWQIKVILLRKQFPPGSFIECCVIECCGTKAGIVVGFDDYDGVDYWDMVNGRWGSCSLVHCGPRKMRKNEVDKILMAPTNTRL